MHKDYDNKKIGFHKSFGKNFQSQIDFSPQLHIEIKYFHGGILQFTYLTALSVTEKIPYTNILH